MLQAKKWLLELESWSSVEKKIFLVNQYVSLLCVGFGWKEYLESNPKISFLRSNRYFTRLEFYVIRQYL